MPSVSQVRPQIWNSESILDLYDDGSYSAIWGVREDDSVRSLGVRWNGSEGYVGYPNQGKNPVWYSEPEFLQMPILLELLRKIKSMKGHPNHEEFHANLLIAISECNA